jgi:hypothetical protein
VRTAAGDPDLRAAGHTLPQVGRLPLLWWALGVAGGGRGGLLGGSDSDFTEGVRVGRQCTAAAQTQWHATWAPGRRPKASVPPESIAAGGRREPQASESLWVAQERPGAVG